MHRRCPTMLAAILALAILTPSPPVGAQDLCAGKTPPAESICHSVGKCDPATGEFALVDKTPSNAAPACKKYTGGCDAAAGGFVIADVVCPAGYQCTPSTGKCTPIDRCANWIAPQDADKCNTYTCDPKKGTTHVATKTCDAGQFCAPRTGECKAICVDNDLGNKEEIPGQLVIKGTVSSTDRCTSDGKLEQVGCDAEGGAKVYTATPCSRGACINGICADLCTDMPANDRCTISRCDPTTGTVARTPAPPPTINACQTVGACDATTGYAIENKPPPAPIDACHVVGECNPRTGEFAQSARSCAEGQECSVQGGGCVAINKCAAWTAPADRCNIHSCDPATGEATKLPVQPPAVTACQTVRACDVDTGYDIINTTCPVGQECNPQNGACVAIGSIPPPVPKVAEPLAPVAPVAPETPMSIVASLPELAPAPPVSTETPAPVPEATDSSAPTLAATVPDAVALPTAPATQPAPVEPTLPPETQAAAAADMPVSTETPAPAPEVTESSASALAATVPDAPALPAAPDELQAPSPAVVDPYSETPVVADPYAEAPAVADPYADIPSIADPYADTPAVADPYAEGQPASTEQSEDAEAKTMTECALRARRICMAESEKQAPEGDIRLLSDIVLRDALTADSSIPIALDDPAVQHSLTLVGESFMGPQYITEYTRNDDRSRLAYCIRRVTQLCDRPEADRNFVIEDCSDPKYVTENAARCPLRIVQQAACTGSDSVLVPSTSSVFEVKPSILSLPDIFKPEQMGTPLLLESYDAPLQQYILLTKNIATATSYEVLAVDPRSGLVRVLGIDKGQLSVVKDSKQTGAILVLTKPEGIAYLPNAWGTVAEYMKEAVPIDQAINSPIAPLQTGDTSTWGIVPIPTDEIVLSALPNDKGLVVFTGNADGTFKGIWYFASISDESGKFILIPDASKHLLRKAFISAGDGKIAADLALKTTDASGTYLSVMHSDDILTETPLFTEYLDQESGTKALKKAISEEWVENSAEKASEKKNPTDKALFEKLLSNSIFEGTVGVPAASHGFMNYGEESSALVIQPNGLDLFRADKGTVAKESGEFLSSGTDGEVCRKTIAAVAVDMNAWGGKDVALISDNGSGTISIAFYANANLPPMIKSLTATGKPEGVQLGVTSITEEGEISKCKWEAYHVLPDGTFADNTAQLHSADSCTPIFKTENIAAGSYVFRVTTTDPLGLTASAQETVQLTLPPPPPETVQGTETAAPTQAVQVSIVSMEKLTHQTDAPKEEPVTAPPPPPPAPAPPTQAETMRKSVSNQTEAPAEASQAPEPLSGACSLTRTVPAPSHPHGWWMLLMLTLIPLFIRVIKCPVKG